MAGDPHADNVVVERGKALLFDLLLHMNATNDVLNDRSVHMPTSLRTRQTHTHAHTHTRVVVSH
jgi:hypothetical protein